MRDFSTRLARCLTCTRLTAMPTPPAHIVAAAEAIVKSAKAPKEWKTARDAEHTIVEVTVGFKRRIVFALRHGDDVPSHARSHSIGRSKPVSLIDPDSTAGRRK